jgi:hypothetical protein
LLIDLVTGWDYHMLAGEDLFGVEEVETMLFDIP